MAEHFALEHPHLRPLPAEPFDAGQLLRPRVDAKSRVCVRQCFYSVPVRYAGMRIGVRLGAETVEALDGAAVVARHARAVGKGVETLDLDHYLETLAFKPGALSGSTALAQARASGRFSAAHDRFFETARRRLGDKDGTKALIGVLLAHRVLPYEAVVAGIEGALAVGSVDPDVVVVEARRTTERHRGPGAQLPDLGPFRPTHPFTRALRRPIGEERMTKMTQTAAIASIGAASRELHLPTVRAEAERLAEVAERSRASHLAYLADVLALPRSTTGPSAGASGASTRLAFPRIKRLADFDVSASPVDAATIASLASGVYLDKGEPVVLLGDSGTGKSHLLIGMGMAACEQGRAVRYATCAGLVNELVEAADERRLSRLVSRYGRLDLLLLDELGYVQLDTRGAELFFQILTEREEKSSIAVASNLPFSEWGQVITDPRLVAAIVDRMTFRAHIIETGTESFRLRTTRKGKA